MYLMETCLVPRANCRRKVFGNRFSLVSFLPFLLYSSVSKASGVDNADSVAQWQACWSAVARGDLTDTGLVNQVEATRYLFWVNQWCPWSFLPSHVLWGKRGNMTVRSSQKPSQDTSSICCENRGHVLPAMLQWCFAPESQIYSKNTSCYKWIICARSSLCNNSINSNNNDNC